MKFKKNYLFISIKQIQGTVSLTEWKSETELKN